MEDFSKRGMVTFADMMTAKGWINANTGGGYKAALGKVLSDLPDDTDVRTIDVKQQVLRYNNLNPGDLSPASLKQYEKRVASMIQYYVNWKTDPTTFKPPARQLAGEKSEKPKAAKSVKTEKPAGNGAGVPVAGTGQTNGQIVIDTKTDAAKPLVLPFPIRSNFMASITVPPDMTKSEAARLCSFITILAAE